MSLDYPAILETAWAGHCARREQGAPTVVSLFAGAGGSSLGYSMGGYRELLAVERHPHAVATLRENFPNVPVFFGDIQTLDNGRALELAGVRPGELDVLDGSPPCQGFSNAGRRDAADPRNQLFLEFVRLLKAFSPRVFVMENVGGMVKGRMKLVFADVMRALKSAGYRVSARLMNAKYFHVPQSRERMIFIGVRNDWGERYGIAPSHPAAQSRPISMREAIGDLLSGPDPKTGHVWIDESPQGRNTKTWAKANRARQGQCYAGQQRRWVWSRPSPTLTKCSPESGDPKRVKPPYLRSAGCHPLYTRTLSFLEYRRIGAFPPAFVFPGNWAHGVDRIGNSVPPLFMRAIATHVREHILQKGGAA